jgi:hypothetical protein
MVCALTAVRDLDAERRRNLDVQRGASVSYQIESPNVIPAVLYLLTAVRDLVDAKDIINFKMLRV